MPLELYLWKSKGPETLAVQDEGTMDPTPPASGKTGLHVRQRPWEAGRWDISSLERCRPNDSFVPGWQLLSDLDEQSARWKGAKGQLTVWPGHWGTSQALSESLSWPRRRDGESGQHEAALGNLIPRYLCSLGVKAEGSG